jgi:dGTPase
MLASYAAHSEHSQGRLHAEPTEPTSSGRNNFQRDRDRIVHSTAFRRLEYKTQVFLNHEGDHFRTRLTHSLEVAQIARAVARRLKLNEDLVEAIALAHDLGHTPFGHAGQDALHECLKEHGGFEHNLQSLWVVDFLEERYPSYDGLNLSYETREGILKHCSPANLKLHSSWLGDLAQRFIDHQQTSLEGQLANVADEVAYSNHDIDDGIRSGLLPMSSMTEVSLWAEQLAQVKKVYPNLEGRRLSHEVIRHIIHILVDDMVKETQRRINEHSIVSIEDVRKAPALVGFSPRVKNQLVELKRFLFENLYRHPRVLEVTQKAAGEIQFLFAYYLEHPNELPHEFRTQDLSNPHRRVAHYIAGMTDRFARREYARVSNL